MQTRHTRARPGEPSVRPRGPSSVSRLAIHARKRQRIVLAQRLDITHLEAGLLQRRNRP